MRGRILNLQINSNLQYNPRQDLAHATVFLCRLSLRLFALSLEGNNEQDAQLSAKLPAPIVVRKLFWHSFMQIRKL
jgi:hypothetical protein